MPRDFFVCSVATRPHRLDRSLLRTYERSTCTGNSSIVFTDTKSGPMKKRTTPLYVTCTSPMMRLLCPPKFCISIIFNFCCDGCNIQEKWKITWNLRLCKILGGGGGGGGSNTVHYGRCPSAESSYLDRTKLVNKGFILWPNYRGFDSQRLS